MQQLLPLAKWVEIDLDAIEHNYLQVRRILDKRTKVLGVVKADAYGHGAVEVARILEKNGVDMLGVTTVEEGSWLRENQISLPILVFGPFLPQEVENILEADLTVTISSKEQLEWLNEGLFNSDKKIKIHLKVETGMGRTGFMPSELIETAREITQLPGFILEGIYSHLATAMWKNKKFAQSQFKIFQNTIHVLEQAGISGLIKHISNSAAILDLPQMHLDMVRLGTLLYGQYPAPRLEGRLELKDPWVFKSRIIYLRELPAGWSVGYGRTFKTSRTTKIAVVPVGFSDGFQLEPVLKAASLLDLFKGFIKQLLSYVNHPIVSPRFFLSGGEGRVIGKVGMQLTMIDVTGIKETEIGAVVRVPVRRTAVSMAVPRVYLKEKNIQGVRYSKTVIYEHSNLDPI